ncbi:MAG: response regulator transcription factor [Clostridia bacterium]|nr:response regulator transcription factor [Clostridia bacterium]
MKKILVLEDEKSIRDFVVLNLSRAGYDIVEAQTGEEALELFDSVPDIDIAVLDVMLPGIDGFEVCKSIRASNQKVGIIMLTAKAQENDKVTGLMNGADDYVAKPFSPLELIVRVDSLYRRVQMMKGDSTPKSSNELEYGPFVLNTKSRMLTKNGSKIELTQVEYQLVKLFVENAGDAFTREEIFKKIWGDSFAGDKHKIVDVNIRRLRVKIEDDASAPTYIQTVWGYGYRWGNE